MGRKLKLLLVKKNPMYLTISGLFCLKLLRFPLVIAFLGITSVFRFVALSKNVVQRIKIDSWVYSLQSIKILLESHIIKIFPERIQVLVFYTFLRTLNHINYSQNHVETANRNAPCLIMCLRNNDKHFKTDT